MDQRTSDERAAITGFLQSTYHEWGEVDFLSSETYSWATVHLVRKPGQIFTASILSRTTDLSATLGLATGRLHLEIDGEHNALVVRIDRLEPEPAWFSSRPSQVADPYEFVAGLDYQDKPVRLSLIDRSYPHTLIAGDTGSGKTNFLHTALAQLLRQLSPREFSLLFADPGQMTQMFYAKVPHLLHPLPNPVISDPAAVRLADLENLVRELERRSARCREAETSGRESLLAKHPDEVMPVILLVIDEFGTLAIDQGVNYPKYRDLLLLVLRLGRKFGIHVMITAYRPIRDVLPAAFFEMLPGRIAFYLSSPMLSELMLGNKEAAGLRHWEAIARTGSEQRLFTALYLPEQPTRRRDGGLEPSLAEVIAAIVKDSKH
jgi:S-DNA-T family DNA segregation ATPase FtsK/SpoIIIE